MECCKEIPIYNDSRVEVVEVTREIPCIETKIELVEVTREVACIESRVEVVEVQHDVVVEVPK